MIRPFLKRFFHLREATGILYMLALACIPVALSSLVRGAGLRLFLPVTMIGILLTGVLAALHAARGPSMVILLGFGPAMLFIHIGEMSDALIESLGQTASLIPSLYRLVWLHVPLDFSHFLTARHELLQSIYVPGERFWFWLSGIWQGLQVEDPLARSLGWSLGLWLIAVWAGWQLFRNRHALAGMAPSTILLAFVVDYTNREKELLWLHLGLLLFLLGLSSFERLQGRWVRSRIDYSESTSLDTLLSLGALTIVLVSLSAFLSTISFKDLFEDLRQKRGNFDTARTASLGLERSAQAYDISNMPVGLPRVHLIESGVELSRNLVMIISTGDLPPMPRIANPVAPRYYWRTFTYQIYTGRGWMNPEVVERQVEANRDLFESSIADHRRIAQKVTFPDAGADRLYWAGTLLNADVPFRAAWLRESDPQSGMDPLLESNMLAALAPVESYQAESLIVQVDANELRASPAVYPNWVRDQFLDLPEEVTDRVLALGRDLTASARTPFDRALAIQNYLRGFPYTLEVDEPPDDREVADYFLFDLQKGYCDYYATTMVVLARAAGLPARLVVGYANGVYDPELAQYVVTENFAHSWVEVYFTNIGWVEFEPTSSQPAIRFSGMDQTENADSSMPKEAPRATFSISIPWTNPWLPAALLIGIILVWAGGDVTFLLWLDPPRSIQVIFRRLRKLARPLGGIPRKSQTAHQFASSLAGWLSELELGRGLRRLISPSFREISHLTDLYTGSLFAPQPPSRRDAQEALKLWSRLQWRIVLADMVTIFLLTLRKRREKFSLPAGRA